MSETSENINVNDQRYKLSILKKAVIEERAKTEKITAELNKYKEELIIKQELHSFRMVHRLHVSPQRFRISIT